MLVVEVFDEHETFAVRSFAVESFYVLFSVLIYSNSHGAINAAITLILL